MIEATCSACGTLNRVPEASVPPGAKFLSCTGCKSRIQLPSAAGGPPTGKLPPAIPSVPPALPSIAKKNDAIDLADLPAPKRNSALGPAPLGGPGATVVARPSARSGLSAALDPELPRPSHNSAMPALDLDDLPTNASGQTYTPSTPSPPPAPAPAFAPSDGGIDLPAPKQATKRNLSEPARDPAREIADLPAPKAGRGVTDLPGPRASRPGSELAARPSVPDVPSSARGVTDLPAPKAASSRGSTDLPAPKQPVADLPAPKRGPMIADLPAPKTAATRAEPKGFFDDLPQPPAADLPAPKGFFDDLAPEPDPGAELAPKGFFDDLPQPIGPSTDLPAPKGFFDDLPQAKAKSQSPDLPAPKGFFDDLPQAKAQAKARPGAHTLDLGEPEPPAPKGFFDDIPGLPHTAKPEVPAPKGFFEGVPALPNKPRPEPPAPKGFFDDIPGRPIKTTDEVAPKGFFDDIPGRPVKTSTDVAPKGFFDDLPQPSRRANEAAPLDEPGQWQGGLELDGPGDNSAANEWQRGAIDPGHSAIELESGPELDLVPPSGQGAFDELDLSPPTAAPAPAPAHEGVRIQPSARPTARAPGLAPAAEVSLELEAPSPHAPRRTHAPVATAPAPIVDEEDVARAKKKRTRLALGGLLAAVALGGGGFVLYQRHAAKVARETEISEQLAAARSAYAAADPKHWQRAGAAAQRVLALDDKQPEALGIGAESLFASAIADGVNAQGLSGRARGMLDTANTNGISSPQLARARALSALVAHQPDGALGLLQPLANQAPKDGPLALYLGWALDEKGDAAAAIKAYDVAVTVPAVKVPALYGRGTSKLQLADLEGARADFAAVLEADKDHIGAQVGLAAAAPPSASEQQESDLLAILARKDLASADPRAVAEAWTRAGDSARRAGRYDVARERYRKALAGMPQDLAATTGLADTELRDGKLGPASDLISQALAISKDNVAAQLVQSELEVIQHKYPVARQRLDALAAHPVPLAPLDQARLQLITGKLLEAEGKPDEAIDAYVAGAKAAGDLDLAPLMAAVDKLAELVREADKAKDTERAAALRARSEQLLGDLAGAAERDPRLALQLGLGYLQGGDADKAEPWLRKAADARPKDAEARFQLGRALLRGNKNDAALEALTAATGLAPERADIGAALAAAYEALNRDDEAGKLYDKLVAGKDPSLELRGRAGRFYARTGKLDKAAAQGTKIVEADPGNAAGLYLKGEGLLAAGKPLEAKQAFQRASDIDRDARYLEALGRAAQAIWNQSGDREAQDLALRSFVAASELDPNYFEALAGQGTLYLARHEAAKAVPPLLAANKLNDKNAVVMFLIGSAYQELQQARVAIEWLEAAGKLDPQAAVYWRLGQLYRDTNQGAKAAGALNSATRLGLAREKQSGKTEDWLSDALYLLGRVNLDLHNEAGARDAWQLYVARNPPGSAQLTEVKQMLATSLR